MIMWVKIMKNNFWKDKKVLVTGAAGFIGSYLVQKLIEKGANVTCLIFETKKDCNFFNLKLDTKTNLIYGSLLDNELLTLSMKKYQIDTVFHLAAQPLVQLALESPAETIKTNILGTLNVLEVCRLNNVKRVLIASSDKAYGSCDKLPYDETFPLKGEYPYDVSKSCTDLLAQSYGKTYDMFIGISRSSNVYGGGDLNFDRIIPETIKHILFEEPILIRSDGQFVREFFYVKDAANAYLFLAENLESLNLKGEAFNFGTDKPIKIIDLVNKIKQISGKEKTPLEIQDRTKAEIRNQFLSSEKAKKILNWSPEYDLESGLIETYNWYKNYFNKNA